MIVFLHFRHYKALRCNTNDVVIITYNDVVIISKNVVIISKYVNIFTIMWI